MASLAEKIKDINESFQKGVLPDDLNFSIKKNTLLDDIIDDVRYKAFFKEYQIRRFYPYANSIPGFDNVINKMVKEVEDLTLTELLEKRKENSE
jgi:hypothetical protein